MSIASYSKLLVTGEEGSSTIEYALLVALISLSVLSLTSADVSRPFTSIAGELASSSGTVAGQNESSSDQDSTNDTVDCAGKSGDNGQGNNCDNGTKTNNGGNK